MIGSTSKKLHIPCLSNNFTDSKLFKNIFVHKKDPSVFYSVYYKFLELMKSIGVKYSVIKSCEIEFMQYYDSDLKYKELIIVCKNVIDTVIKNFQEKDEIFRKLDILEGGNSKNHNHDSKQYNLKSNDNSNEDSIENKSEVIKKINENKSRYIDGQAPIMEITIGDSILHYDISKYTKRGSQKNINDIKLKSIVSKNIKDGDTIVDNFKDAEKAGGIYSSGVVKSTYHIKPNVTDKYVVQHSKELDAVYKINEKYDKVFVIPSMDTTGDCIVEYANYGGKNLKKVIKNNDVTFKINSFTDIIRACDDLYRSSELIITDFRLESLMYDEKDGKISIINFITSMYNKERRLVKKDGLLNYTPAFTYFHDDPRKGLLSPNHFWYTFLVGTLFRSVDHQKLSSFICELIRKNIDADKESISYKDEYKDSMNTLVNKYKSNIIDWCKNNGITEIDDINNIIKLLKNPFDSSIKDLHNYLPRILLWKN